MKERKMTTATAGAVYEMIVAEAEKNSPELRDMAGKMDIPGDTARQGDVYAWRLPDDFAAVGTPRGERQVAVGTTTGSRHVAEGAELRLTNIADLPTMVSVLRRLGAKKSMRIEMIGPVVEAGAPWCLTHPEHAHVRFDAGKYAVTYQWDQRAMARVAD